MTKDDIIKELADNRVVEKFVINTMKTTSPNAKDLSQDIYVALLEIEDEKIIKLHEKKQLEYFIARMITNNYHSNTSPYYYKYCKFLNNTEELKKFKE